MQYLENTLILQEWSDLLKDEETNIVPLPDLVELDNVRMVLHKTKNELKS